ncbi:MAG: iron-containing alcohol dehydrogenase, partial [Myxococcales bacterium]|nr:iron-containing alcohol dehydrogenase [Myxococcales bacterium]
VSELAALIERTEAHALASLGGGSPIDTCKVATHALLDRRDLVHVAVPTTLSAGEFTHSAGVTDDATRIKSSVSDPRLQARAVIHDPKATEGTPDGLWAATGIRALDHAVESSYAIRHHPLGDALGAKAIRLLLAHLPGSVTETGEARLAHRGECQMAAWFSIFSSMNTRFGLSHLLGHQIGPRWNIAHGVTSCITLPHAMRFMASIAPERFGPIAEGFGVPFDPAAPRDAALTCADRTAEFVRRFDLPHSLERAGVPTAEIADIVGPVLHELERTGVVDRPMTRADVFGLLESAYRD